MDGETSAQEELFNPDFKQFPESPDNKVFQKEFTIQERGTYDDGKVMVFMQNGAAFLKIDCGFWADHGGVFEASLFALCVYQAKPLNDGEYQVEARLKKGFAKYEAMGSTESET